MKTYSDLFVSILTERLNETSSKEPNRELCKSLLNRKMAGEQFTIKDLDRDTFITLCVNELCTDAMIGAIFNVPNKTIMELRNVMGLTDSRIAKLYSLYVTAEISSSLEKELGDAAFA